MDARRSIRILVTLALAAPTALGLPSPASAVNAAQPTLVSADPANGTPHVLDGQVNAVVQVGNWIVAGGHFATVREPGGPDLSRSNIFAFDATTWAISQTFAPTLDGDVLSLATDGTSVFVGGSFRSVNGTTSRRIAKLDVTTGQRIAAFSPNISSGAAVYDMALANGELYIGGAFSTVNGQSRQRLAALDPVTGALDPDLNLPYAGKHNRGTIRVAKLDVSPDGSRLITIGNFVTVAGQDREQAAMIDLTTTPASLANWQTDAFKPQCASRFDTYLRDVDFAPDGSYFVIGTTGAFMGGPGAGVYCDSTTRWETNATGAHLVPTWADYTGGDTTWSVAATGTAVYVGGHQRWWNNPYAADRAGAGSVSRMGIAALDPLNGLPFSWNPVRDPRGEGAFALTATATGLWVGSDTDYIGGEYHAKLAFMPLAGGSVVPVDDPVPLPNDLYSQPYPSSGSATYLTRRGFDGSSAGVPSNLSTPGVDWAQARGSFVTKGRIYAGWSNGTFVSRTFDGTSVGPAQTIGLNGLTSTQWPVSSITGMFFTDGRIYYTVSGNTRLYYRYFTPEDDLVGAWTFTVSGNGDGLDWSQVRGMTYASGRIYFARSNGSLYRMDFDRATGRPVPGTEALLAGPGVDGRTYTSRGMFLWAQGGSDTFPPSAPGKPVGTSTSPGTIDLSWTASVDNVTASLTYRVYRDGGSTPITTFTSSSTGTLTYQDGGLAGGSTHTYVVTATDGSNNTSTSPASNPITVLAPDTTPPTVPGKPTGVSSGSTSIDLTWAGSTDDRSGSLTYRIYRDGGSTAVGTVVSSASAVSFTDAGLATGSTHTYVVTATDASDNTSDPSPASDPVTAGAGTIFADDFSSADFSKWTDVRRLTIDGSTGGLAVPSARAQVTGQNAWAAVDLPSTQTSACVSFAVNVTDNGGSSLDLMRLRTAGNGNLARLLINGSRQIQFRSDVTGIVRGTGVALPNGWSNLELCGAVGSSSTWDVYLNGTPILNGWVADTGTNPIGRVQIGDNATKTFTVNFDDVVVDTTPG